MSIVNLKEAFAKGKTAAEKKQVGDVICEDIRTGKLTKDKLSLRNIAEATLGQEGMDALAKMNGEGELVAGLRESVDPVNLSAFTNITGQLIIKGAYEAYKSPDYIGDRLVTTEQDVEDNVRVPGLALIDDDALNVAEGGEYPAAKFGEDYIDVPGSVKKGLRIALTRELIFFDRTGKLMELAQGVGERLGTNKEKRILRVVLGLVNNHVRKGVARNTYVASADPRINKKASFALTDWDTFDTLLQMFNDMSDDRATGEPIMVRPDTLLVAQALEMTAARIAAATQIRTSTDSNNTNTYGANPVAGMISNIVTSPWIQRLLVESGVSASDAKTHYYWGSPKRAFRYRTLFPFALTPAPAGQDDDFNRDVLMQWKASERGVAYSYAPWHVIAAQAEA